MQSETLRQIQKKDGTWFVGVSRLNFDVDGKVVPPRQHLVAVTVGEPLQVSQVSEKSRLGGDGDVLAYHSG